MKAKLALFVSASLMMGLLLHAQVAHGQDAATEEAREHFRKGQQFFDVGRWDEAAGEFEKAYAVRSDPTFLYNMAQAFRRKGDAKRALDLYKNYLIKAPKTPQRAEVEERIRTLQKQLDEEPAAKAAPVSPLPVSPPPPSAVAPPSAPAPAPAAPTPAPAVEAPAASVPSPAVAPAPGAGPASAPEAGSAVASPPAPTEAFPTFAAPPPQTAPAYVQATPPRATVPAMGGGLRVGGIAAGATGVAVVGAGVFFSLETRAYSNSVQSGTRFDPNIDSRGKLYNTLQWVSYAVGGALIATGAVLYGLGVGSGGSSLALAPVPLPAGAGFSAQGSF